MIDVLIILTNLAVALVTGGACTVGVIQIRKDKVATEAMREVAHRAARERALAASRSYSHRNV